MSVPTGYKPYRSYRSKAESQRVTKALRKQGKRVTTREVAVKGKGVIIRVFVK
jgi:hypothetical protein